GCTRRLADTNSQAAGRARTRAFVSDPSRRRTPVAQPVAAAPDPPGPDRYARGVAAGADRGPRWAATRNRAHGADAALFPARRPPAGAVQRLARRRRGLDRSRSDAVREQRTGAGAGRSYRLRSAAGGPKPRRRRYRQAAAARFRRACPCRDIVL